MNARAVPHVTHVIYRLDIGGLESGLVNLVNRMPAERYRHSIVCTHGYAEVFRRRIQRNDVEVVSLDRRPGKDPGAYLRAWRLLRRLRPDIVHTRNLGTVDLQWIAALAGVPHRVHGEHGWGAADLKGVAPRSLRIRRACRPAIHRYVTMSQDLARWLERDVGVPADRIRQLYSGVDVDRFGHEGPVPDDLPWTGARGSAPTPLVFGTVGRLDPVKGQDRLLEAFASVAGQTDRPLRLVIVGDGPARACLVERAHALGLDDRVWFAGARSDVPALMRAMDVFVLPSLNEGISNTILEAMASGRPVIASRVGGNPELIADGITGTLYAAGDAALDAAGLVAAMSRYMADADLVRAHGAAARERTLREFSLDAMVSRYLAFYDDLLAGR